MSMFKEFNYSNINQRKIIYYNAFITFIFIGYLFTDIWLRSIEFFFYFPVARVVLISLLLGLFIGNFTGRLLFKVFLNSRIVFICTDILFISGIIFYFLKGFLFPGNNEPLFIIFNYSEYFILLLILIPGFLGGIKINYFLKVSSGSFIDEKMGIIKFILFSILGLIIGLIIPCAKYLFVDPSIWNNISVFFGLMAILILPSIFFIDLSYYPKSQLMQHFTEEDELTMTENEVRDSLIFTYLNFSYVIIYLYLGLESIIKVHGDIFFIKLFFIIVSLLGLLAGFFSGNLIKKRLCHIYTELIFPVFVFPFIFILNIYLDKYPFYYNILFFVPSLFIFGFSLYHAVKNIISNFNHEKRFNIISISFMILPVPIIIALDFINFNYLLYFLLLYLLGFANILIPGISILGMKIKGYIKALYFIFCLIMLILVIFCHNYFKINFSKDIYASKTKNYEDLKKTNFNALFIKNKSSIYLNGYTVFNLSDSNIRNTKRSLIPLAMFRSYDKGNKILFIDGNQKFFRNPVIGYFNNSVCLDPIPDENVDFNKLPITGKQIYISESMDLLFYLKKSKVKYETIVDIPNIYDQAYNHFKFSEYYFSIIKKSLSNNGIFSQLYNIKEIRSEFFIEALKNHQKLFKNNIVFLFSDIMLVISSDDKNKLILNQGKYNILTDLFNKYEDLTILFYNEYNILSHLINVKLDSIIKLFPVVSSDPLYFFYKPNIINLNYNFYKEYIENNTIFLNLVENTIENNLFNVIAKNDQLLNNNIYSLIKKTELAESNDNYEEETKYLFELKNYSDARPNFRKYLNKILFYKEEYYYNAGLRFEGEKRWIAALSLYKASLTINSNNFNTNYKLGLLCITLQDFENAFKYFNQAMTIDKNHPKVFYQIGVLLFSSGKINEAINHFNKAIELKESNASLYLYLGLCYEKLNNLSEAENYYAKALLLDANDDNIKFRLDKINVKRGEERNKWKTSPLKNEMEVEQGEKMPLPINKSAIDWRLTDKEAEKIKDNDKQE